MIRPIRPVLSAVPLVVLFAPACESPSGPPHSGDTPEIQVASPHNFQVVSSTLPIDATCTDDGPRGCTLEATLQRTTGHGRWDYIAHLGKGAGGVEGEVALSVDPGLYTVAFTARDAADQFSRQWIHIVQVDIPPEIEQISDLPGLVAAYDGDRILWLHEAGTNFGGASFELRLRDVASGMDEMVGTTSSPDVDARLPWVDLVSDGVFAVAATAAKSGMWRSSFYDLNGGFPQAGRWFAGKAGDYYLWEDLGEVILPGTGALWRGGPDGQVEIWPSHTWKEDVAENGIVVFSAPVDLVETVFRFAGGVLEEIGPGAAPVTDGMSMAYARFDSAGGTPLVLRSAAGVEEIISETGHSPALRNGYLAYMEPGSGVPEVWVRSPDGVETKVSTFGPPSGLHSLGPAGEVVLRNPYDPDPWNLSAPSYYLAVPPYGPGDITLLYDGAETGLPEPTWVNGELHVLVGDLILKVWPR